MGRSDSLPSVLSMIPCSLFLSLSLKFKAADIYGVLIRYKTVGWVLLEKQKLKKGPYHEPFYNLVSRKTCMQKTVENVCKNKVHEKFMWQ